MGGKCKDLTGQKFGKLTVIKRADSKGGQPYWLCECECGNIKNIMGRSLRNGKTKSCGCLQKEKASEMCIDLTGQKFGRLTVLEKSTKRGADGNVCWVCICECGNIKEISSRNLRKGFTTSCGCWNREKIYIQRQDEYFIQQHKKGMNKLWDEEFRQRRSVEVREQMKEQWQDEEYRNTHGEYLRQRFMGEKNPNWSGGTTLIRDYFSYIIEDWSHNAKQNVNFTCEITGEVLHGYDLHTHHLYSFSNILKDIHNKYNIVLGKCISDYTYDELRIIEKDLLEWHNDNTNAVVLKKEVHYLFHSIYGMRGNTAEQFQEFKEKYKQGFFNIER